MSDQIDDLLDDMIEGEVNDDDVIDDPESYPEILPVFPLPGALLLPGGRLPLHIFEPRYRNMVADALEEDGFIGMIQPLAPDAIRVQQEEEEGVPEPGNPRLYSVGCAGEIDRWERLPDGRYIILLRGVARFRVRRELPPKRGYRRVEADYDGYFEDSDLTRTEVSADRLMGALHAFGEAHQVPLELETLSELPALALLNSVAMALPFQPAEKQALLEAPAVEDRLETLLALMDMGVELNPEGPPPTLN